MAKALKMSIQDIMGLDLLELEGMSTTKLRQVTSALGSAANKRVKRAKERGEEGAPALRWLEEGGGKISVAGKGRRQLMVELQRAQRFLTMKTSTAQGYRSLKKQVAGKLGIKGKIKEADWQKLWSTYRKLKELHPMLKVTEASEKGGGSPPMMLQALVAEQTEHPEASSEDLLSYVDEVYEKSYEAIEEDYQRREEQAAADYFSAKW